MGKPPLVCCKFFRRVSTIGLFAFVLLFLLANAYADPITGTYSDRQLTLHLQGGQGAYSGSAVLGGAAYPVAAQGTPQNIQGTYSDRGSDYPFQAVLQGDVLTFRTDGKVYLLKKQGPLSQSGPLAQPAPQIQSPAAAKTQPDNNTDRFIKKEDGFSLALAGGFYLINNATGNYLLGSKTAPGLVLVKPVPGLTTADIEEGMRTGHHEEGVRLVPSGAPETLAAQSGTAKAVTVTGTLDGAQVQGILAGFTSPKGQGLVVIALTTPEEWPNLKPHARTMIQDVRLFKPSVSPLVKQWDQKLRGMKMTYMSTFGDYQGGGSTKIVYALCSDGSFSYSGSDSMSFDIPAGFGSTHSNDGGAGTWNIRSQGGLMAIDFAFNNGNSRSFQLSNQGTKTFLDNTRYFVTANDICR